MRRYRIFRLCKLLGCKPSDLLEESAVDLDWMLAIEDTENAAAHARSKRSAGRTQSARRPAYQGGGFNVG